MARAKKASRKAKENAARLTATQPSVPLDTQAAQLDSQTESQPPLDSQAASRSSPYIWLEPAEVFLIEQLKNAIRHGERVENGFHPRIWDRIITQFVDEGHDAVTRQQLKSKHDYWKAKWKLFELLADQSGWGINEDGDTLVASEDQWQTASKRHGSGALKFKGKAFKYRGDLNEIFDGTAATGQYARVTALLDDVLDDDHNEFGDPDQVPRAVGNYTAAMGTAALNDSQFISIEPLSTGATLANSLLPETLLSTAGKRKLRADESTARRVRQRGDDGIRRLADAVINREYNVPGGNAKEEAIGVFQSDYTDVLEAAQFYAVLDRFNDPQNVITFNSLVPGERRDGWIRHLADL